MLTELERLSDEYEREIEVLEGRAKAREDARNLPF